MPCWPRRRRAPEYQRQRPCCLRCEVLDLKRPPRSGRKACSARSTTESRLPPMRGWPLRRGKADRTTGTRVSPGRAGKPRLRTTMIQIAWLWLRHQPQSALTLWFRERIKRTGGRLGKTMIVALARKLLVALWKYATAGVLMEGAILKHV